MRVEKSKEQIIQATIELINEKDGEPERVTIREICGRLGISVGLINYHFKSKDNLIEESVKRIIDYTVEKFISMKDMVNDKTPKEKLKYLSYMNLTYLFKNPNISKMSIVRDFKNASLNDNTDSTTKAYISLIEACVKNKTKQEIFVLAYRLIFFMQTSFIRADIIESQTGINLYEEEDRKKYIFDMIDNLLEGK